MIKIRINAYDAQSDVFSVGAFGFAPEDEAADPDYCRSAPDFDDFEVPLIVMSAMIGRWADPTVLGQVFELTLPDPT